MEKKRTARGPIARKLDPMGPQPRVPRLEEDDQGGRILSAILLGLPACALVWLLLIVLCLRACEC